MNVLLATVLLVVVPQAIGPSVDITLATPGACVEADLDTGGRLAVLLLCGTMDINGLVTWLYGPGMIITFTGTTHWIGPRLPGVPGDYDGRPLFVLMYCPTSLQLLASDTVTIE
jgi:hypothetical protein